MKKTICVYASTIVSTLWRLIIDFGVSTVIVGIICLIASVPLSYLGILLGAFIINTFFEIKYHICFIVENDEEVAEMLNEGDE